MVERVRDMESSRIKAAIGVAALHLAIGYALVTGLGSELVRTAADPLKLFDVAAVPPPPVTEDVRQDASAAEEEGAASPPNLRARPTPVVAPPPEVRIEAPPPLVAADRPSPFSPANDRTAGNAAVAGPGTGSGGTGIGTGSGGQGSGAGGGGVAAGAERLSGGIANADYPRASLRAGVEGSVAVRFTVGVDGRVSGCRVLQSSANAELDTLTCRLIERRFRYRPARDANGNPVPEAVTRTFDWTIRPR